MTLDVNLTEGKATFVRGSAFYRPHSQTSRDLGVLAAAVYRSKIGRLRVLDTMTGCGLRSLRYGLEAGADLVWANDADPEIHGVLTQNLKALEPHQLRITQLSANQIFWRCAIDRDYYDLLDIDSFGNPGALLASCLQSVCDGGLIYLTSTDGRTISGHFPQDSLRLYGTYTRAHPCVQEHALRILIGSLAQQAAMQGFTVMPVFSLYSGQIYRVMVRVTHQTPNLEKNYGFVGYCPQCGDYAVPSWRYLSRASCPHHGNDDQGKPVAMTLAGPLWTGVLHDRNYIQAMIDRADDLNLSSQIPLLEIFRDESDLPPYHYPLGEVGRRGKMDIPKRDRLIEALINLGYRATATHLSSAAIKTDASLRIVVETARFSST